MRELVRRGHPVTYAIGHESRRRRGGREALCVGWIAGVVRRIDAGRIRLRARLEG